MESARSQEPIKIGRPEDLLSVIPYLLGFSPTESVVVLVLQGGRLRVTARFDLAAVAAPHVLSGQLARIVAHTPSPQVLLVAYSADFGAGQRALLGVEEVLAQADVLDRLVTDGVWWERPGEPGRWEYDAKASPAAAEAVVSGLGVCADRRAFAALVAGPGEADRPELEAKAAAAVAWAAALRPAARRRLVAEWVDRGVHSRLEVLRLAALVTHLDCRDLAWFAINPENALEQVELWGSVVAAAVPPLEVAPLCLLAAAGWASGNGALQGVCLERAARIDPEYRMLRFLELVNLAALPPCAWEEAFRAVPGGASAA